MQGKRNKTGADAAAEVTPRRPASTRVKDAVAVSRSGYPGHPHGERQQLDNLRCGKRLVARARSPIRSR